MAILRSGDIGAPVAALQRQLNARLAAGIKVDGWYGNATAAAVRRAQQRFGLVVDGIAGPKTMAALAAGEAAGRHLRDTDLLAAAEKLDVPLAAVRAVNEVESRGEGFLPDGRPVILFERHIMYRQLQKVDHDAAALAARYPNIVNVKRGGYAGGAAEHMRLAQATAIDHSCAIESASWGAFQIMGFHWELLGYASAVAYAAAMQANEAAHLDAFVRFILADPKLHKALKARRWPTFAEIYNGPAYRENMYDTRLARAFERYDTELEEA